jgi:hypothetical protein
MEQAVELPWLAVRARASAVQVLVSVPVVSEAQLLLSAAQARALVARLPVWVAQVAAAEVRLREFPP